LQGSSRSMVVEITGLDLVLAVSALKA
jgi:hypothetical protein